jgi:DMSO/TMAO reductase YedYZ molybdopterin-dependent catalytic subunit
MKKKTLQTPLLLIIFGLLLSGVPTVSLANPDGALEIIGEVNHPIILTLEELEAMPQTTVNAPLYCYGALVTSGNWTGVKLSLLLELAEYKEDAMSVRFEAEDGYTITLLLKNALREDVIIAYEKNGQPLPETLRLVVPGANGSFWISMIVSITVSTSSDATEQESLAPPKPVVPSPTPQPSATPQPTPTPQSTPSASPSPSPTQPPLSAEASPPEWITAAAAGLALAVACASLLIYFKKRRG